MRRARKPLSPRQRQIFQLRWDGLCNQEIAQRLGMSPRTVQVHARAILWRYRVENMVCAYRRGLKDGTLRVRVKRGHV